MSVIHQRLTVLLVLATGAVSLLMPTAAFADITGCATETTSFYNADEDAVQHFFYDEITKAEAGTPGAASVTVTCESDSAPPTITLVPASTNATGTATVGAPATNGNERSWEITWVPDSATVAAGARVDDHFVYTLDDNVGSLAQAVVDFSAVPQFDIVTDVTAPATVAVPATGATITYVGSNRNAGPDMAIDVALNIVLSATATVPNLPAGCTLDTVEVAPDILVTCVQGNIAIGETKTVTVNATYVPGTKGLVLPSTTKVMVNRSTRMSTDDLDNANNSAIKNVSLIAATCAAGQTGTPPNCVTPPAKNTPTIGNDTLIGTIGPDFIRAGAGDDVVNGGAGNDRLFGETGNDRLLGGTGNDAISGGAGNDIADGGAGNDKLSGDSGNDRMGGGAGNDALAGGSGNDRMLGGAGNDKFSGGAGNDTIICGSGTDKVLGGAGNDKIGCKDGKGGDVINGGPGRDACYGDANDRFISCERITRI